VTLLFLNITEQDGIYFDVCLFKASEKMLKAWQENEERAATFVQVMGFLNNIVKTLR